MGIISLLTRVPVDIRGGLDQLMRGIIPGGHRLAGSIKVPLSFGIIIHWNLARLLALRAESLLQLLAPPET